MARRSLVSRSSSSDSSELWEGLAALSLRNAPQTTREIVTSGSPERWPTELILHMFEFLPAKDIQRCRRVCKRLQAVIDDEKNKNGFLQLIQKRKIPELQKFINENILYKKSPSFLEKLARWLELRGVWPGFGFGDVETLTTMSPDTDPLLKSSILFMLNMIAMGHWRGNASSHVLGALVYDLVGIHVKRWKPPREATFSSRDDFVQRHVQHLHMPFTVKELGKMYEKVCLEKTAFLPTNFKEPDATWDATLPPHTLTTLRNTFLPPHTELIPASLGGGCDPEAAILTFDLPAFDMQGLWAYHLPDGSVWEYLQRKMQGATQKVELDVLVRAAVLEEISIW